MKEMGVEFCDCTLIHHDLVKQVAAALPDEGVLLDVADLFKMFADSTRVKIICALTKAEMCVCDIAALLAMSASAISHQLRLLRQSKLVKYRREGKVVYYSLDDEHVRDILDLALVHLNEGR
jgi:ArsR family transcriptional regulator